MAAESAIVALFWLSRDLYPGVSFIIALLLLLELFNLRFGLRLGRPMYPL